MRECCPYREAKFQGRLWIPELLSPTQRPHIWICGCAPRNTLVGTKFSAMQNLATWSSATVSQSTDANRPIADTYVNGKLCPRFSNNLRFTVSGATKGNAGILALYNDTSTNGYVTVCGTTFNTGGGNYGTWHGYDNDTRLFSSAYTSPEARGGVTRFNGSVVDPVNTVARPDALTLFTNRCSAVHQETVTMIGADSYTLTDRSTVGVLCEMMIWVTTLPTARTIELCEGYVAWFWGRQSALSASHPFRNRPPLIGD